MTSPVTGCNTGDGKPYKTEKVSEMTAVAMLKMHVDISHRTAGTVQEGRPQAQESRHELQVSVSVPKNDILISNVSCTGTVDMDSGGTTGAGDMDSGGDEIDQPEEVLLASLVYSPGNNKWVDRAKDNDANQQHVHIKPMVDQWSHLHHDSW